MSEDPIAKARAIAAKLSGLVPGGAGGIGGNDGGSCKKLSFETYNPKMNEPSNSKSDGGDESIEVVEKDEKNDDDDPNVLVLSSDEEEKNNPQQNDAVEDETQISKKSDGEPTGKNDEAQKLQSSEKDLEPKTSDSETPPVATVEDGSENTSAPEHGKLGHASVAEGADAILQHEEESEHERTIENEQTHEKISNNDEPEERKEFSEVKEDDKKSAMFHGTGNGKDGVFLRCNLTDQQLDLTEQELNFTRNISENSGGIDTISHKEHIQKISKLLKICDHPDLCCSEPPKQEVERESYIGKSGKLHALQKFLKHVFEEGQRVIILASKDMLEHLKGILVNQRWGLRLMRNDFSDEKKETMITKFNELTIEGNSRCFVFLIEILELQNRKLMNSINADILVLYNAFMGNPAAPIYADTSGLEKFKKLVLSSKNSIEEVYLQLLFQKKAGTESWEKEGKLKQEEIQAIFIHTSHRYLQDIDQSRELLVQSSKNLKKAAGPISVAVKVLLEDHPKSTYEKVDHEKVDHQKEECLFHFGSPELNEFLDSPSILNSNSEIKKQIEQMSATSTTQDGIESRKRSRSPSEDEQASKKKPKPNFLLSPLELLYRFGLRGGDFYGIAQQVLASRSDFEENGMQYSGENDLAEQLEAVSLGVLGDGATPTQPDWQNLIQRLGILELVRLKMLDVESGDSEIMPLIDEGLLTDYSRKRNQKWNMEKDTKLFLLILNKGYDFWQWYKFEAELGNITADEVEERVEVLCTALLAEDLIAKLGRVELHDDTLNYRKLHEEMENINGTKSGVASSIESVQSQVQGAVTEVTNSIVDQSTERLQRLAEADDLVSRCQAELFRGLTEMNRLSIREDRQDGLEMFAFDTDFAQHVRLVQNIEQSMGNLQREETAAQDLFFEIVEQFCIQSFRHSNTQQSTS